MYNREASKFNSTMAMGFALLNIDAIGTPSTALGPRLGMESTSLSRLLNNMEKKKLIVRKQNPNDGRGVLIFLTEFGKDNRDDSRSVVLNFNNHITSKLNKQQIRNFLEVSECILRESKKFENFLIN
jgi:DNA-binding MarR family transcriptional regulator